MNLLSVLHGGHGRRLRVRRGAAMVAEDGMSRLRVAIKPRFRKHLAMLGIAAMTSVGLVGGVAGSANAVSGSGGMIIVSSPSDVPAGAVEDSPSQYQTDNECDDTRSWTLTVPGTEAVTHIEKKYKKTVTIPGKDAVTHKEYKYQRVTEKTKTQWYFAKYTETRSGVKVEGEVQWGAYGPWVKWSPETHTSWQDSDTPLGSPAYHADWKEGNTYYYRLWQARPTGLTRTVPDGTLTETTSDWVLTMPAGSGWVQTDVKTVTDEVAVPPSSKTVYYDGTADGSVNEADATWVKTSPGGSWAIFDQQTVTDHESTPAVVTHYGWSNGVQCSTKVEVPKPETNVICGPDGNDTWVIPTNNDTFSWTLNDNGDLIVSIVRANTTFNNGTTAINLGQAPDANLPCNTEVVTVQPAEVPTQVDKGAVVTEATVVAPAKVTQLAFTGAETVPLGLSGLFALLLGAGLVATARRQGRRANS